MEFSRLQQSLKCCV